ncbi:MAG: SipW-dependent-type signal peptide-containing protein [Mycetocola sp.]
MTLTQQDKPRRGPRIRAALAGGVVLVAGAGVTLANWTDNEVARTTVTAGIFGIIGSADGTTFTESSAASPAALTFQSNASAMVPGQVVYAGYSVRTIPNSVAGTVTIPAPVVAATGTTAVAVDTIYRSEIKTIPAASACNATTFAAGTSVIPSGVLSQPQSTAALVLNANGANTIRYCTAITLLGTAPNNAQGAGASVTWTFAATSSVPSS